jgi:hypothetical protein
VGVVLATVACGTGPEPTQVPAVTTLTIEPSTSCTIGDRGLPLSSYVISMQDQRSGTVWRFVENRDPGGSREPLLTLNLRSDNGSLVGTLSGPAIIDTLTSPRLE